MANEERRRTIRLSSPKSTEPTNILQWQFAMTWAIKSRKLWYLIEGKAKPDDEPGDRDSLISFILDSIHEDNIGLIMMMTDPKEMWHALESSHMHNSAGSRYYHLRSLMSLSTPEEDGMTDLLLQIDAIGAALSKLCKDGKIAIEDLKIAALISSLPNSLAPVISPFERQLDVSFKEVCDAVRSAVVNNSNRNLQQSSSSHSPFAAQATGNNSTTTDSEKIKKKKGKYKIASSSSNNEGRRCTFCNSPYHTIDNCIKKQNSDLRSTIESLAKKVDAIGGARLANEPDSDFSDSMAQLANASAFAALPFRWNLDSACSNSLIPETVPHSEAHASSLTLRTANNSKIHSISSGNVALPLTGLSSIKAHVIKGLAEPLLSVSDLTDLGKSVLFMRDGALVINNGHEVESFCREKNVVIGNATRINRSYYLDEVKDELTSTS